MQHLQALLIKFVMSTVVLYVILGIFYGAAFSNVLWLSAILSLIAYMLGDLIVLPIGGNAAASLADAIFTFLAVWILGSQIFPTVASVVSAAIISGLFIAAGEWFFHNYMKKRVLDESRAEA